MGEPLLVLDQIRKVYTRGRVVRRPTFTLEADLVIDQKWYGWIRSSEPDLNRRGAQLVGQVVVVVDAIPRDGRGSVKVADTVWPAEGVEAPVGARVRISGCKDTVLRVGPA